MYLHFQTLNAEVLHVIFAHSGNSKISNKLRVHKNCCILMCNKSKKQHYDPLLFYAKAGCERA